MALATMYPPHAPIVTSRIVHLGYALFLSLSEGEDEPVLRFMFL